MNKYIKLIATATLSFALIACSSVPEEQIHYKKAGKVQSVKLMQKTKKPSFVEVLAGATLGGLLGNQLGGGSGKYWATGIGALGGGAAVHKALSEKYKEIHYEIFFPEDGTYETLISKDLAPTIFKGDLVSIERHNDDVDIVAYGTYNNANFKKLSNGIKEGKY